jgi:uncharacterized LabA/DUF88 family protein
MSTDTRSPPSFENASLSPPMVPSNMGDLSKFSDQIQRVIPEELRISEAFPGLNLHEPTALLLDINNLYKTTQYNGFRIDFGRLKSIFEQRCDLRYCAAFSATDPTTKSAQWVSYMENRGYDVITKPVKTFTNGSKVTVKGNMDIELACEALTLSPAFTHVIIGTCDGDFIPLVKKLQEGHIRHVSVLGTTNEKNTNIDRNLIRQADFFYDLTKIQDIIQWSGRESQ